MRMLAPSLLNPTRKTFLPCYQTTQIMFHEPMCNTLCIQVVTDWRQTPPLAAVRRLPANVMRTLTVDLIVFDPPLHVGIIYPVIGEPLGVVRIGDNSLCQAHLQYI